MSGMVTSIILILIGLMAKYSNLDGWKSAKPYAIYLIVVGCVSLALDILIYVKHL